MGSPRAIERGLKGEKDGESQRNVLFSMGEGGNGFVRTPFYIVVGGGNTLRRSKNERTELIGPCT